MLTVSTLLAVVALGLVILAAIQRAPLWPAVLVLVLLELTRAIPLK